MSQPTMTRCSCRPGCLAWLRADDDILRTPSGLALAEHLTPYPTDVARDVRVFTVESA